MTFGFIFRNLAQPFFDAAFTALCDDIEEISYRDMRHFIATQTMLLTKASDQFKNFTDGASEHELAIFTAYRGGLDIIEQFFGIELRETFALKKLINLAPLLRAQHKLVVLLFGANLRIVHPKIWHLIITA